MKTSPCILLCLLTLLAGIACNEGIHYPEGGYEYPKDYANEDTCFYYYPLRDSFSRKDSFLKATDCFYFRHLHEPNLSLKYLGKDLFRLTWASALGPNYVIVLTENEIVVKHPGDAYFNIAYSDNSPNLTSTENYLAERLSYKIPFDTSKYKKGTTTRTRMDSLLKIYPQMADVNYYWQLVSKIFLHVDTMQYVATRIPITHNVFVHLISLINSSGYWAMPNELDCVPTSMDGDGFHLEANTPKRYNIVGFGSCEMNTPMQKRFATACQELVNYAKLGDKISLTPGWKTETAPMDTTK